MSNEEKLQNEYSEENAPEIKESFNIFKLDGALSRSGLFILFTITLAIGIVTFFLFYSLSPILNMQIHKTIYLILVVAYSLFMLYIYIIGYIKRLYDIIGDKKKAIFYTTVLFIALSAASFIPIINYIGAVVSLCMIGLLFFKKGKLIK